MWSDGRKYLGNFEADLKDGHGSLLYPDGRVFVGQWKNNKQNGRGNITNKDGTRREGEWSNGKVVWWYDADGNRENSDVYEL